MALTQSLSEVQLKQNIDALMKAGKNKDVVQSYVDNYAKSADGLYVLKTAQAAQPVKNEAVAKPMQTDSKPIVEKVIEDGIPAISAPFKSDPNKDSTTVTALKTAGNLPTDLVNVATGALNFLNPIKNIKDIVNHVGETYKQIQDYSKKTGENPFSILGKSLVATTSTGKIDPTTGKQGVTSDLAANALKMILPQFVQDISKGDFVSATKHIVEQPAENIAPLILLGKGLSEKIGAGAQFDSAMSKIASPVTKGIPKAIDLITPEAKPSADKFQEASGQIFQPKNAFETTTAQKVAANVDFSKLPKNPTYEDLSNHLQKNIDERLGKVNDKLNAYQENFKPADLTKKVVGGSGKTAKINYVQEAIKGLKDLYKTTKDPQSLVDIKDLETKFKSKGLNAKEINDLAKQYGTDIGKKAFSKIGEPLTSTNAQAFENIRKGVKEAAHGTLPDEETRALDKNISSLIKAKDMSNRMATKVDQLSNKIMKRGIGEKLGRQLGIVADWASLGSVKGFVAKLFPSNVGLKTMNSLDLESALGKNLKTIEKLTNTSDSMLIEAIKKHAQTINNLPSKIPALSATSESRQ